MKTISNKREIVGRLVKGFNKALDAYDRQCHDVIQNPREWSGDWGTTHRKNGEFVTGGNRNIVDVANLDESQRVDRTSEFSAELSWDGNGETPAALVHEGYTTKSGKTIPARRWTEVAASEIDLANIIQEEFRKG